MRVQVCLTLPGTVIIRDLELTEGTTAEQAVRASGLVPADWAGDLGLFGVRIERDHLLAAEDRVELYHALPVDPRTRRRARAAVRRAAED